MPENALSAFVSAIWARRYATESLDGEIVCRGRNDAERARTFPILCTYEVLGASLRTVTTTPGRGPIPWTEDAVSSYVASVTKGELAETDCVSDSEDISRKFSASSSLSTPT